MINNRNNFTIGLVQMAMGEEPDKNLEEAIKGIREAAKRSADVICLPELFRTPYFCVRESINRDYREELHADVGSALSKLAAELKVIIVAGSIFEKIETEKTKGYNTAMVFDANGALLGEYRKTHIPHDPGFYEQNYFISGDSNFKVFQTEVRGTPLKIGVLICYDQWFPEAARSLELLGADVIFYPTAIGTMTGTEQVEGSWQNAWRTVQCGHAVATSTIVAAVNRVGTEGTSNFWGGSFICDAFGRVLAEGSNRPEIITAQVSLEHSKWVRDTWRFSKERRPDTYITQKK
jgi:predicted amidohydrolase